MKGQLLRIFIVWKTNTNMTEKQVVTEKNHWLIIACLLASLLTTSCVPQTKSAAWVIRYDIDSPPEINKICTEAKAAQFDTLLVQVRGRADAYYQSGLAPRAESLTDLPTGFDPLSETLTACKDIPIHAWLNVYYLWGGDTPPEDPSHPAHPNNTWILHDSNGRSVADYSELERAQGWIEGVYADPASEEYRELLSKVVKKLLDRYPLKGIHLDFIRYPGAAYGQTGPLGKLYTEQWGIDPRLLPEKVEPLELIDWVDGSMPPHDRVLTTATLFWTELRASQVTDMVRAVKNTVDRHSWGVKLSVAVDPDPDLAYLTKGQEWQAWAADQLIDALYPMAYFGDSHRVNAQLKRIALRQVPASPVQLWAGLGAYIKEPEQIAEEAEFARNHGYNGITLFSLGHLLEKQNTTAPYAQVITGPIQFLSDQQVPS